MKTTTPLTKKQPKTNICIAFQKWGRSEIFMGGMPEPTKQKKTDSD